jgi:hypothetical protein
VTVSSRWSLAAMSRWCTGAHRVEGVADGPERYAASLTAFIDGQTYDAVVPASDAALLACRAPVTSLLDKAVLAGAAAAVGLASPPATFFPSWADLVEHRDELAFPVVVKPCRSTSPARSFDRPDALAVAPSVEGSVLAQPLVTDDLSAVFGVMHHGALVAVGHQRYLRTWPVPCGTASAAVTVDADPGREEALAGLLVDHEGVFQAQFAGPYLIDLNVRVYGSMPLAAAAGCNLVGLACDLQAGRRPPPSSPVRAMTGVRYRWVEGDFRHVARGLRSRTLGFGQAAAALRPRRGTAHSVTVLRDPVPLVARVAGALAGRR